MIHSEQFTASLETSLRDLGITSEDELEVVVGGQSIYDGVVKHRKDAFIVVRRPSKVVSSKAPDVKIDGTANT